MARSLPPLLLLLLLLWTLTLIGVPSLSLACTAADDVVLGEGDERVIPSKTEKRRNGVLFVKLFVSLEPGFKGVCVNATGTHGTQLAWFPALGDCFSTDSKWREMSFIHSPDSGTGHTFDIWSDDCWEKCTNENTEPGFQSLTVVAYGPSRWRLTKPQSCTVKHIQKRHTIDSQSICVDPPPSTAPTNGSHADLAALSPKAVTTPTTYAVIVVVVVLVVVAVVGTVMAVLCRRKCRSHDASREVACLRQSTKAASQIITDNSLYEPLSRFAKAAAAAEHRGSPHAIENDM